MGYNVLVVEDTELLRRMYSDRLELDGLSVTTAADGLEALSILRTSTPDLILLDLVMPRMSGIEVLEVIKKDPRLSRTPVLILSNLGQDSDIERGIQLGAVDYLIKNDARPADVAERVSAILGLTGGRTGELDAYRLYLQDRTGDADAFVEAARLVRRFWCPACEVEMQLEMIPQSDRPGWYDSHLVCPRCGREY